MLLQNQVWTDGYWDSKRDEQVQATNLKALGSRKEGPNMIYRKHEQIY